MIYFIIIATILVLIMIVLGTVLGKSANSAYTENKSQSDFQYEKVNCILTNAEYNFYTSLSLATGSNYIICPKVRLADFVKVTGSKNRQTNFNKISSKHIDFLICNNKFKPILGIELDDKSHDKTKERDNFVNAMYAKIKLPILRIPVGYSYSVQELRTKIDTYIS